MFSFKTLILKMNNLANSDDIFYILLLIYKYFDYKDIFTNIFIEKNLNQNCYKLLYLKLLKNE